MGLGPRHHGFRPNHLWGDLGTGGQSNWTSGLRSPEECELSIPRKGGKMDVDRGGVPHPTCTSS